MNNRNLYIRNSLFILFLLLLSGCVKRALEIKPGNRVRIVFDWKSQTDPAAIPSGLQLWFYGPDNIPVSHQSSATAYEGILPAGNYRVIIYNPDATGVSFRNLDRFEEAETYLLPGKEETVNQPLNGYAISLPGFIVQPGQSVDTTIIPVSYIKTLILRIKSEGDQAEAISDIQATIEGIATELNLSTRLPQPGNNGRISQTLSKSGSAYESKFTLLGSDKQNPGKLILTLGISDGSERIVSQNITEAMQQLNRLEGITPLVVDLTVDMTKIDGVFVGTISEWTYKEGESIVN